MSESARRPQRTACARKAAAQCPWARRGRWRTAVCRAIRAAHALVAARCASGAILSRRGWRRSRERTWTQNRADHPGNNCGTRGCLRAVRRHCEGGWCTRPRHPGLRSATCSRQGWWTQCAYTESAARRSPFTASMHERYPPNGTDAFGFARRMVNWPGATSSTCHICEPSSREYSTACAHTNTEDSSRASSGQYLCAVKYPPPGAPCTASHSFIV